MTATEPSLHRWCSFRLGDDCFAVDTAGVVEVLRSRRLTRVPLAAAGVLGLVHLRGRIVPVIDPAVRLGAVRWRSAATGTHLVVATGGDWYGLSVDEMLDVLEIPDAGVERPTSAATRGEAVLGTYAAGERLVHLLDPGHLIQSLVRPAPHAALSRGGPHGSG